MFIFWLLGYFALGYGVYRWSLRLYPPTPGRWHHNRGEPVMFDELPVVFIMIACLVIWPLLIVWSSAFKGFKILENVALVGTPKYKKDE